MWITLFGNVTPGTQAPPRTPSPRYPPYIPPRMPPIVGGGHSREIFLGNFLRSYRGTPFFKKFFFGNFSFKILEGALF